ncbi:hypothetical protein AAC387_Pa07g2302 [Persea americana]
MHFGEITRREKRKERTIAIEDGEEAEGMWGGDGNGGDSGKVRVEWRDFMVRTTWAMRFLSAVAMLSFPTAIWAILVVGRKGEMLEETHDWAVGSLEKEGMSQLATVTEMLVLKAEIMVGLVSKNLMWVMEV